MKHWKIKNFPYDARNLNLADRHISEFLLRLAKDGIRDPKISHSMSGNSVIYCVAWEEEEELPESEQEAVTAESEAKFCVYCGHQLLGSTLECTQITCPGNKKWRDL